MPNHEHKVGRGDILQCLFRLYPDTVGDNVLISTFTWMLPHKIEGHIAYLVDSGYVEREEVDRERFEFSSAKYVVKITPKGIDLFEKSIAADPGIQIPNQG